MTPTFWRPNHRGEPLDFVLNGGGYAFSAMGVPTTRSMAGLTCTGVEKKEHQERYFRRTILSRNGLVQWNHSYQSFITLLFAFLNENLSVLRMTDSLRLPAPDMVTATPPGCQNGHPEALPLPAKTDVINLKQVPN